MRVQLWKQRGGTLDGKFCLVIPDLDFGDLFTHLSGSLDGSVVTHVHVHQHTHE